jgi:hypothetical protein
MVAFRQKACAAPVARSSGTLLRALEAAAALRFRLRVVGEDIQISLYISMTHIVSFSRLIGTLQRDQKGNTQF